MRGVHQPDRGMVYAATEILDLGPAHLVADTSARRLGFRGGARRRRHIDPDQPVLFAHRICPHLDLVGIEILPRHQRWDRVAHAILAEAPAVIGAFHAVIGFDPARRQGHAAMRTDIAQGENFAGMIAPQQHRLAQQHFPAHVAALEAGR